MHIVPVPVNAVVADGWLSGGMPTVSKVLYHSAAWYITRLLIKLTPKGVLFSFLSVVPLWKENRGTICPFDHIPKVEVATLTWQPYLILQPLCFLPQPDMTSRGDVGV